MADEAGATGARLTRPLVLVGLMGAGKSSVGKRVASQLDVPFVDVDELIEERAGATIAELFERDGEPAFREREERTVAELLDTGGPVVIATGGGAVLSAATRDRLRAAALVVWLRASPGTLIHRAPDDGTRPLLAGDPKGTLKRLHAERGPLYDEVADVIIDVDRTDRRVVSAKVLDAVAAAAGVHT